MPPERHARGDAGPTSPWWCVAQGQSRWPLATKSLVRAQPHQPSRSGAVRQLVGFMSRRSRVRVPPPPPLPRSSDGRTPDSGSGDQRSSRCGEATRSVGRVAMQRPAKAYAARAARRCKSYTLRHSEGTHSWRVELPRKQQVAGMRLGGSIPSPSAITGP